MTDKINIVLLAAGKGTRLKLDIPKPLCPALGKTLVDYVVKELEVFSADAKLDSNFSFVVGHQKELVESHITENFSHLTKSFAWQKEQLGTGHALQTFFNEDESAWENKYTLVVCADTPLIKNEVYTKLFNEIKSTDAEAVCATFHAENPYGYGRIDHSDYGFNIVEEKDTTEEQRAIQEVNSGLYIFKTSHIKNTLFNISDNNKSGEFYLTDLFKKDYNVRSISFTDDSQFIGVNNLVQLETVENILLKRKIENLQLSGVRFLNSSSTYIEEDVQVAPNTVIYPGVSLFGKTRVSVGVTLENGVILKNTDIGAGTVIKANSYLEGANIGSACAIGPMARLREGTVINAECKIGNFVETKKSNLSKGVKVSHLSYVGDAEIGENTNIGCGFITCNYDGANKHKTIIGKDSFIGSDVQMIAPITLGDEVYVGSGSTINKDIPDGGFGIARQRQTTKEGMAHRFIKKKG